MASIKDLQHDNRHTQIRIRIRIPEELHHEPVISRLVSHHEVTVNIEAAQLGENSDDEGWFDLELSGTTKAIDSALTYLNDLDLEILHQSSPEEDGR